MIDWEPWAMLDEAPEGHPAFVPLDVVADINGDTSFRRGPFTGKEVKLLNRRLKTFEVAGNRYFRAIEEAKAADDAVNYYPPGPERDSAVVLRSVAREELASATAALQVAAAKLTATIRALRAVVASRRLSTGNRDVDSAAVRAGLTGRSDAVREAATALVQLGVRDDDPLDRWVREGRVRELIRGARTGAPSGSDLGLPGGVGPLAGITGGGPGLTGWIGAGRRIAPGGGRVVATTAGVGPASSTGSGTGGSPGTSAISGERPGHVGTFQSAPTRQGGGGGHTHWTQADQDAYDAATTDAARGRVVGTYMLNVLEGMMDGLAHGNSGEVPGWFADALNQGQPNPVTEAVSLSRDPFIAAQQAKALGFAGRTIRTPNGPVLAFPPEGGASATGDTTGTINWDMLDPVAPYAGGDYEPGRGPRAGGASRRTRIENQFIEALYPEGSGPGAEDDDETLATIAAINTGRPMPAPEAPGDPAAMRFGGNLVAVSTGAAPAVGSPSAGTTVAYSAGVGSPTIEFDGAGRVRRVGR